MCSLQDIHLRQSAIDKILQVVIVLFDIEVRTSRVTTNLRPDEPVRFDAYPDALSPDELLRKHVVSRRTVFQTYLQNVSFAVVASRVK